MALCREADRGWMGDYPNLRVCALGREVRDEWDLGQAYKPLPRVTARDTGRSEEISAEGLGARDPRSQCLRKTTCRMHLIKFRRRKEIQRLRTQARRRYWMKTYIEQRGICAYCHFAFSLFQWTIDHIIPLSRGGTNKRKNIVGCCKRCNEKKADRLPNQFTHELFL